jgi:hypothetical protein
MSSIDYILDSLNLVHRFIFHNRENVPLRVLISAANLGLDGPHLIGFVDPVNRGHGPGPPRHGHILQNCL